MVDKTRIVDTVSSVSKFKEAAESALYQKVGTHISNAKVEAAKEIIAKQDKE